MKTIKFLSMAALALVGAVMTGCSSDDNIIDTPQQPANNGKTVTLTMSVGLNGGGETRALAANGTKTFAAGEKMAVIYKNNSDETAVAETEALVGNGDITNNGKTATFTVTLEDPNKGEPVMYIYPASMAKADGTVNYDALNSQNGTLGTLESSLDLATFSDDWNGTSLPAGMLENQLAVCALTLKNSDGSSTITSGLTQVTVSDGSNTYTVTPTSSTFGEDVIYVAIRPVTAALQYTATDGTTNYTKTATSREYAAGNFYNLGLRMVKPAATVTTAPTAKSGAKAGLNDAIVNAGTATGGTMMYAVTTANTKPTSTEDFSATVPTSKMLAAGTCYVWYYVKADASHTDSEISATGIEVTIDPAKAAAEATAGDKGKLIGTDGNIYADVEAADAHGTNAVAKIIYIGTSTGATNNHGLALALTDETGTMAWQDAMDACSAKNSVTSTTAVTNATWMLASQGQWNLMKGASGAVSYTALRDGFGGITGASNLESDLYWSSSVTNIGSIQTLNFASGSWKNYNKSTSSIRVRACLDF